jgi:plastocyanin
VTRRTLTLALGLLLAVAVATPAASQHEMAGHDASGAQPAGTTNAARIGFDAVRPSLLQIVRGESVTWTNDSARIHTVTADDDSFDSGRLSSTETFTHRFAAVGEAPYHCQLHPSIRGVVEVLDLLLAVPGQHAATGKPFPLAGRSAFAAGTPVTIEADTGAGFTAVAQSITGDDGSFAARVVPRTTAQYRAVAEGTTSPPVQLLVEDHRVALSVTRMPGGHERVRATVTPRTRGGRLVLQLFLPERFGWWPVRRATLGKTSGATFTVHSTRRLRARVRYTLADGATALATSRIVHVGAMRARRHG